MKRSKILLVDDHESFIKIIAARLQIAGYDVISASDPLDGLSLAVNEKPDLITLDVMMPTLNGYEFLAELRNSGVQTRVIMVTAEASVNSIVHFIKGGACDYLVKPISPIELERRIKKALMIDSSLNTKVLNLPPIVQEIIRKTQINSSFSLSRLHPEVVYKCDQLFTFGHYNEAIFCAFRLVEERVRELANGRHEDVGVKLVSLALGSANPAIELSEIPAEQDSAHALFRGAIGYFKNPRSHRTVGEPSDEEAFEALAFASLLIRLLEEAALRSLEKEAIAD